MTRRDSREAAVAERHRPCDDGPRLFTVTLSRQQALRMGLLYCKCGHPPNNHFDHGDMPCAHCKCTAYDERLVPDDTP